MSVTRPIRYLPPGGGLVEVVCRTLQGRYLLRPDKRLNPIIVGALSRAKQRYPVRVHDVAFLSNHAHLLISADDPRQMSGFMGYAESKIAREAGRLYRWKEKLWGRRYSAIPVSDEEKAQVERLRYCLSQGCKENLVARPQDWPGVHGAKALLTGRPLRGIWIDRGVEGEQKRRGGTLDPSAYVFPSDLVLDPLPCWERLTPKQYRARVAELVFSIEVETTQRHEREGSAPMGRKAVEKTNPHSHPRKMKNSPAPRFHAATKETRRRLRQAYAAFVLAYRAAAEKLRAGDSSPNFPAGCFPPPMPFVPARAGPPFR